MTVPHNLVVSTRHGIMVANRNDQYVGRSMIVYGEFSEHEVEFIGRYLRPDDVVLDIGANVGALTVPLAKMAKLVVAFEPQRYAYQSLCANLALNSLTNVMTYPCAVGDPLGGEASVVVPVLDPTKPNNFGAVELGIHKTGEEVPLLALDAMPLPPARVVKVDVEGMEAEVLRGARKYIAEHQPVLYLESDRAERRADLLALLEEMGYDVWWHVPWLYNPDNFRRQRENVFQIDGKQIVSYNFVALPRSLGYEPPEGLEKAA